MASEAAGAPGADELSGAGQGEPERALPPIDLARAIPCRLRLLAELIPTHEAVVSRQHRWSYSRLLGEAERVAAALLHPSGAGEDGAPVALMFAHEAPLIAAIFGVLFAGRCFAVLDPCLPLPRNRAILANLGARWLLFDRANMGAAAALAGGGLALAIHDFLPDPPHAGLPAVAQDPGQALGIFHTTGTTGEPKGLLWRQSLSLRRALTDAGDLPIHCGDRHALFTSPCFPAAVSDILNALLNGAALHLYDIRTLGTLALADWLRRQGITALRMPAALFRHLRGGLGPHERIPEVRALGLSGDVVYRQDLLDARRIFAADCRLIHRYSLSEAGMVARRNLPAGAPLDDEIIPAGEVAPGKRVVILNEAGVALPDGEFGEIALGEAGLAAGYWVAGRLQPMETLPDPLLPGGRLFCSGDRGRRRVDGCLELAGRRDHRVKIRGYRVEIAAVEAALRELPEVRDAAVIATPDADGERSLLAHVVLERPADEAGLQRQLALGLPAYMRPSRILLRDALPLAPNGKLDRSALESAVEQTGSRPSAAGGSTEERLRAIWQALLRRDPPGVDDDFFLLGGHSLLAARLLARVHAEFGRHLSLLEFYRRPTIAGIARCLEGGAEPPALGESELEQIRRRTLRQLGWE